MPPDARLAADPFRFDTGARVGESPEGNFPRDPVERRKSLRVAQARTRADYVAALIEGGLSPEEAEAAAVYGDVLGTWKES